MTGTASHVLRRCSVALLLCLTVYPDPPAVAQARDQKDQHHSFEAARHLLYVGQEVWVTNVEGRTTRGSVISVSGSAIEVGPRRFPLGITRSSTSRAFERDAIAAIGVTDSTWNGALLGAAVSAAALGAWAGQCKTGECSQGRALTAVLGTGAGMAAGAMVDSLISHRIYERPPAAAELLITPALAGGGRGVIAQLRW